MKVYTFFFYNFFFLFVELILIPILMYEKVNVTTLSKRT